MAFAIAWPGGVDGAQRRRAAFSRCAANLSNVIDIGSQFGDHRDIYHSTYRGDDFPHHIGVLSHRHPVPFGVRARKVEFQAIRHGGQFSGDFNKLFCRAAKDRDK